MAYFLSFRAFLLGRANKLFFFLIDVKNSGGGYHYTTFLFSFFFFIPSWSNPHFTVRSQPGSLILKPVIDRGALTWRALLRPQPTCGLLRHIHLNSEGSSRCEKWKREAAPLPLTNPHAEHKEKDAGGTRVCVLSCFARPS